MAKKKWQFHIPNLNGETYRQLLRLSEQTKLSTWTLVTLGLHMLFEAWARPTETMVLKDFTTQVRAKTRDLNPSYGEFVDHEAERQTKAENGGL